MLIFSSHPIKNPDDQLGQPALVTIHEHEHNTNEGSEFLDDAIRMHDQPLIYTEESIAAGSPENLL